MSQAQSGSGRRVRGGYTLVEAMVVLAIIAILAAISLPSLQSIILRSRLKTAADRLRSDMSEARTTAMQRGQFVYVSFNRSSDGAIWCWGLSLDAPCDCRLDDSSAAGFCFTDIDARVSPSQAIARRVRSTEYRSIWLAALPYGGNLRFGSVRPDLIAGNATFTTSSNGDSVRVVSSSLGRLRLCSPNSPPLLGLPAC